MNLFVFDIETIPDVEAGRKIYGLTDELSDKDVAEVMFHYRRQKDGQDFLPLHLHKIITISAVLRTANKLKIWSLGQADSREEELVQRFYDGIEKFTPTLVSWNGGGFDLPVLHYRSLKYGINAARYWDVGDDDREYKWNNYLSRFHWRHIDLMDVLSAFQARAVAPLHQMATLLGFPGKMGMEGSQVWQAYLDQRIEEIRQYCETDVLNTYLIFLRFQLVRGHLNAQTYAQEMALVKETLDHSGLAHWQTFSAAMAP